LFCFCFSKRGRGKEVKKKRKRITWNKIASKSVNASHDDHRNGRQTPPQHQKDVLSVFWDCDFRDNNLEKKNNKKLINKREALVMFELIPRRSTLPEFQTSR